MISLASQTVLEKVDLVGLRRGGQRQIAHLAVFCGHPGGLLGCHLGGRSAGDLLQVVQDRGRWEERSAAGRRSLAEAARCSAAARAGEPARQPGPSWVWATGASR